MTTNQGYRSEGTGLFVQQRQGTPTPFWPLSTAPTLSTGLTAVADRTPTTTAPADDTDTGRKVIDLDGDREFWLELFGQEAEDASVDFQVFGWKVDHKISKNALQLWTPHQLIVGTATFGTMTGVAGAAITDTWRFADAFTVTTDRTESPGNVHRDVANAIGWLYFRVAGYMKLEIQISGTSSIRNNGRYWTK